MTTLTPQVVLHELPNSAIIVRASDCFHAYDDFSHYLSRINARKRLVQKGRFVNFNYNQTFIWFHAGSQRSIMIFSWRCLMLWCDMNYLIKLITVTPITRFTHQVECTSTRKVQWRTSSLCTVLMWCGASPASSRLLTRTDSDYISSSVLKSTLYTYVTLNAPS